MKKIIYSFLALFFIGCSYIDYPDEFVKYIIFTSDIIDVEKMQISSKDELIESVDTAAPYYGIVDSSKHYRWDFMGNQQEYYEYYYPYKSYRLAASVEMENSYDYDMIIYIEPLSNRHKVLDENAYKSGMPIVVGGYSYGEATGRQPVILIKGRPEWADSSYKGFTILPVSNSSYESDLDFTWTAKKMKIQK